jgi:hypothetical protein
MWWGVAMGVILLWWEECEGGKVGCGDWWGVAMGVIL